MCNAFFKDLYFNRVSLSEMIRMQIMEGRKFVQTVYHSIFLKS